MNTNAFEDEETNAFERVSEFERAEQAYQEYAMSDTDKFLASLPSEELVSFVESLYM